MARVVSVHDFVFVASDASDLPGLTKELLFELYDAAAKWGESVDNNMLGIQVTIDNTTIMIAAHLPTVGLPGVFVCQTVPGRGYTVTDAGAYTIMTRNIITGEEAAIIWDRRVSVNEAEVALNTANERARASGLILESGERIAMPPQEPQEFKPPRWRVADVFSSPMNVFFVLPDDPESSERIRAEFDHPELLHILPNGSICLKQSLPKFEKRARIVSEILAERGIEDLGALSEDEIMAIKEEIARREETA